MYRFLRCALTCVALLWIGFSSHCGIAQAANGWWNEGGIIGTVPYSYDSYYRAHWAAFSPSGQPYVIYRDSSNGSGATVVKLNSGTWTTVGTPAFSSGATMDGRIAIGPDGTPYVAYRDEANGHSLAVKKFNGSSWIDMGSSAFSQIPVDFWINLSIAPNGTPYVEFTSSGYLGVYRYSGGSWQPVGATVTSGSGSYVLYGAGLSVLQFWPDSTPYVAYSNNAGVHVIKYDGVSWSSVGGSTVSSGAADYPALAVANDGSLYAAYLDKSSGTSRVWGTVMRYDGTSWSQVGSNIGDAANAGISAPGFTIGTNGTIYLKLINYVSSRAEIYSLTGSSISIVNETAPNEPGGGGPGQLMTDPSSGKLSYVGEWTGNGLRMIGLFSYGNVPTSGSSIGTAINPTGTGMTSLRGIAFDSTGTGYVSFIDYSAGRNATVMKYANGAWTTLGSAGIIPTASGSSVFPSYLTVGPDDVPYVLFREGSNGRTSVAKWNGSAWTYVGSAWLSSNPANPTQLLFSASGAPYAIYRDGTSGFMAARYFDGASWRNVGPSETIVSYASSAGYADFAPNGSLYVAINDVSVSTGRGPTVIRWDGSSWSQVGSARIGNYAANSASFWVWQIYVGADGTPYILATDAGTASTIPMLYLWKFDGTNWTKTGSALGKFNPSARLAARNGKLYVLYQETVDRGSTLVSAYPMTVKRWSGSDWITEGDPYFNVSQWIGWPDINPSNGLLYAPVIDANGKVSVVSPLLFLNSSTSLNLTLGGGGVSVDTPASIAFPSASSSNAVRALDFSGGTFSIEDLKGASAGWYATVSISNLSDGAGHTISKNNVSATVPGGTASLMAGAPNAAVAVPSSAGMIGAGYVSLGSATTLVQRSSLGGLLGKYGVSPSFRINIPAYTAAGNYSGILTVTIVEN